MGGRVGYPASLFLKKKLKIEIKNIRTLYLRSARAFLHIESQVILHVWYIIFLHLLDSSSTIVWRSRSPRMTRGVSLAEKDHTD